MMANNFTDERIAEMIQAMVGMVNNAAALLENRAPDNKRCNCNAWGRGMCAHHAYAHEQLRETVLKLQGVVDYLLKEKAN